MPTYNGIEYRIGALNAFQQLHIVRKISPLVKSLVPAFAAMDKDRVSVEDVIEHLDPITRELSTLDDSTVEYVLNTALSVVQRNQDGNWHPVWSADARAFMYDDMDMALGLKLTYDVVQDQLGPFIKGFLPGGEPDPASNESA
jgi:hypothetical protein